MSGEMIERCFLPANLRMVGEIAERGAARILQLEREVAALRKEDRTLPRSEPSVTYGDDVFALATGTDNNWIWLEEITINQTPASAVTARMTGTWISRLIRRRGGLRGE